MDGIIWKIFDTGDRIFIMMEIKHRSKYIGISKACITSVYNRLGRCVSTDGDGFEKASQSWQ